jgi:hypothetical protein
MRVSLDPYVANYGNLFQGFLKIGGQAKVIACPAKGSAF